MFEAENNAGLLFNIVQHLISAKCWTNKSKFPHFQSDTVFSGTLLLGKKMQRKGDRWGNQPNVEEANCAWLAFPQRFHLSFTAIFLLQDTCTCRCTWIIYNTALVWVIWLFCAYSKKVGGFGFGSRGSECHYKQGVHIQSFGRFDDKIVFFTAAVSTQSCIIFLLYCRLDRSKFIQPNSENPWIREAVHLIFPSQPTWQLTLW